MMITLTKPEKIDIPYPKVDIQTKKHIVVVEDNIACQKALELYLYEYEISAFENAEDAMYFISINPDRIDLILTDNRLPGMNGQEMVSRIKSTPALKRIPIVMQSGCDNISDDTKSKLDAFIAKPLRKRLLLTTIANILGGALPFPFSQS